MSSHPCSPGRSGSCGSDGPSPPRDAEQARSGLWRVELGSSGAHCRSRGLLLIPRSPEASNQSCYCGSSLSISPQLGRQGWAVPPLSVLFQEGNCFACSALANAEQASRLPPTPFLAKPWRAGNPHHVPSSPLAASSPSCSSCCFSGRELQRGERLARGSAPRRAQPRCAALHGEPAPGSADKQRAYSACAKPQAERECGKNSFTFTVRSSPGSSFHVGIFQ